MAHRALCSLCSSLAVAPTCPAPVVSRPHIPVLPYPSPAQCHLLRGVHLEQVSPVITLGPVSLLLSKIFTKYHTHLSSPNLHLPPDPGPSSTSLQGSSHPPFLSPLPQTNGPSSMLQYVSQGQPASGEVPQLPCSAQIETLRFPHWVELPAVSTCPVRVPVRGQWAGWLGLD